MVRSCIQWMHRQFLFCLWSGEFLEAIVSIWPTEVIRCFSLRQVAYRWLFSLFSSCKVPIWNQAGNCFAMLGSMLIASQHTLYFLAVFIMHFRWADGLLWDGDHVWRNVLVLASGLTTREVWATFTRRSWAKRAHCGRSLSGASRPFSHFSLIASLWLFRCRTLFPPFAIGAHNISMLTAFWPSPSHTNLRVLVEEFFNLFWHSLSGGQVLRHAPYRSLYDDFSSFNGWVPFLPACECFLDPV